MHIITRKRLNEFAQKHPDTKTSWYKLIRQMEGVTHGSSRSANG